MGFWGSNLGPGLLNRDSGRARTEIPPLSREAESRTQSVALTRGSQPDLIEKRKFRIVTFVTLLFGPYVTAQSSPFVALSDLNHELHSQPISRARLIL